MILSYSKKFVFVHLNKCGGTSVQESLRPYLAEYDLLFGNERLLFGNGDGLSDHATAPVIRRFLGELRWTEWKKFVIVRNPVEIMKSFYSYSKNVYEANFFNTNQHIGDRHINAYAVSLMDKGGADQFVSEMLTHSPQSIWPQTYRIKGMLKDPRSIVIDLSQLEEAWPELIQWLDIGVYNPKLLRVNMSPSRGVNLSSETISSIREHFAEDYKTLPLHTGILWR